MPLTDIVIGLMFFGGVLAASGLLYMRHKRALARYIEESNTRLSETINNQPPSSSLTYMQQMETWMRDDRHNHRG